MTESSVEIEWNRPAGLGGFNVTSYTVTLKAPDAEVETFAGIKSAVYTLTNLSKAADYEVSVFAVTDFGEGVPATLNFKFVTYPSLPLNFWDASRGVGSIVLAWGEPQDLGGDESVEYSLYLSEGPIQTAIYSTVIAADIK